jgi:hypothetical protein
MYYMTVSPEQAMSSSPIATVATYTPKTQQLFEVIKRAEIWLENNTWQNELLKWDTENWGEIPADFGRK